MFPPTTRPGMRSLRCARVSLSRYQIASRTAATLTKLPHTDQPFEEELVPDYDPTHFCQVTPGDVVADGRYSIISKLGWGRFSTVWLAKDLQRRFWQPHKYVSIKFNNCDVDQESIHQERALLERLSTADPNHRGFGLIRRPMDSFELTTGNGTHLCLVYKPLRETLDHYRRRFSNGRLPLPLVKAYAKILLVGLDFLHTSCNVIHTDLKLDNILISFEDESVLSEKAQQLQRNELFFKERSGRRVFQSCSDFGPLRSHITVPIIADFGLAENADSGAHPIQPDAYRAPEVLLGWGWSSRADIWNFGNLIWTLASGEDLFTSLHSEHGRYDAIKHLGQMSSILGTPPPALIRQRSQSRWRWLPAIENQKGELCRDACSYYSGPFFDTASGAFLYPDAVPSPKTLHDLATFVDGDQKAGFVDFMSKMLTWDLTNRLNACDLLDHPWLVLTAPTSEHSPSPSPLAFHIEMPVSAIDSLLFKNLLGTEEICKIFNDEAYIEYCINVEHHLAIAQAQCAVIPQDAADVIASSSPKLDYQKLSRETKNVGYPILPLVNQLAEACGEYAGKYVHWGATTQDIQDTASMCQIKDALVVIERQLADLMRNLGELATKYRDTAMPGRTHLQHALPVTFGYKCAVYLSSVQRHLERLYQLRPRCLLVQFGGAAGTLASLGPDAEKSLAVRKKLAGLLRLEDPIITWHTARDGIAEIVNFLALIGGTLGKVATDLIVMSSNEFDEVSEPFMPHRGASSTMPQKRNPISSEVILAASKMLRADAGLCLDAMLTDFERATGPWHLEWAAVPDAFVLAVGALSQANFALSGLAVNVHQMARNLDATKGLIVAEAVMMELANTTGRQRAHQIVYEACTETVQCRDGQRTLLATLLEKREVTDVLSEQKLKELCTPSRYLGAAGAMVDNVVALNTDMLR